MSGAMPVLAGLPQFSPCCDADLEHGWDPATGNDALDVWVECARCGRVYWSATAALRMASSS
jgi:hypothetical protein